jgi:hypothetical protein
VRQQPVAKVADGQMSNGRKRGDVVAIDDQPRDFIELVVNQSVLQKRAQRQLVPAAMRAAMRSSSLPPRCLRADRRRAPAMPSPSDSSRSSKR